MNNMSDAYEAMRGQFGKQRLLLRQALVILRRNQCKSTLFEALAGVVDMQIDQSLALDILLATEQERSRTHERKLEDN